MSEKKFYAELAIYKGEEFRCVTYGGGRVELFAPDDALCQNVLHSVNIADLEDKYTKIIHAVLNGISYVVYDIENDVVEYKRYINAKDFIRRPIADFELIYVQRNHHIKKYTEKEPLYVDESRIEKDAVNRSFWPEEMACGNIMLSFSDDKLSVGDMQKALEELYGRRISEKGGLPQALLWDEYISWFKIDDAGFDLTSEMGIVTISPKGAEGNKYIREIADYLNRI